MAVEITINTGGGERRGPPYNIEDWRRLIAPMRTGWPAAREAVAPYVPDPMRPWLPRWEVPEEYARATEGGIGPTFGWRKPPMTWAKEQVAAWPSWRGPEEPLGVTGVRLPAHVAEQTAALMGQPAIAEAVPPIEEAPYMPMIRRPWPGAAPPVEELPPDVAAFQRAGMMPTLPVEEEEPRVWPWTPEWERITRPTPPPTEAPLPPERQAQAEAWRAAEAAQAAFMAGAGPELTPEQTAALQAGPPTAPTTPAMMRDIAAIAVGAKRGIEFMFKPVPEVIKEPLARAGLSVLGYFNVPAEVTERGMGYVGLTALEDPTWARRAADARADILLQTMPMGRTNAELAYVRNEWMQQTERIGEGLRELSLTPDERMQLATKFHSWTAKPGNLEAALEEIKQPGNRDKILEIAQKHEVPAAEFVGQVVFDPLNVAGFFTKPIAKVLRRIVQKGKKLPHVSKLFEITNRSKVNVAWADGKDLGRVLVERLDDPARAAAKIDDFIANPAKVSDGFLPRAKQQAESVAELWKAAGVKGKNIVGDSLDVERAAAKLGDVTSSQAAKVLGMPRGGDTHLYNSMQRFLMEHWLGTRFGWTVFNGIDNSGKLVIEGINPFQRIGHVVDAVDARYGMSFIPTEVAEGGLASSVRGRGKLLHQKLFGPLAKPMEWNFSINSKLEPAARLRVFLNKSLGKVRGVRDDFARVLPDILGPHVDDTTKANIIQDWRSVQFPNKATTEEVFNRRLFTKSPAGTIHSFPGDKGFIPDEVRVPLKEMLEKADTVDEAAEAFVKAGDDLLETTTKWGKEIGTPHDPFPAAHYEQWGGPGALFEEDGYRLMPQRPDLSHEVVGGLAHKVGIHEKHARNALRKINRQLGVDEGLSWAAARTATGGESARLYHNYLISYADEAGVELPSWFTHVDLMDEGVAPGMQLGVKPKEAALLPGIEAEAEIAAGRPPEIARRMRGTTERYLGMPPEAEIDAARAAELAAPPAAAVPEAAPRITAADELADILGPRDFMAPTPAGPPVDIGEAAMRIGVDPADADWYGWDKVRRSVMDDIAYHNMRSEPDLLKMVIDKQAKMHTEEGWFLGEWRQMRRGVTGAKGRAKMKRDMLPDGMTWPQYYKQNKEAAESYMDLADELEEILVGGPPPRPGPLAVRAPIEPEGLPLWQRRPEVAEIDVTRLPTERPPVLPEAGMPLLPPVEAPPAGVVPGELAGMPPLEVAPPGVRPMEVPEAAARGEALLGRGAEELRRAQVEEVGRGAQMGMFGEIEEVTTPAMMRNRMANLREEVTAIEAQMKSSKVADRMRAFLQKHIDTKESEISDIVRRLATEETGAFRPGEAIAPIQDELNKWKNYVTGNWGRKDEVITQSPEAMRAIRKARAEAVGVITKGIGEAQIYGLEETNRILGDYYRTGKMVDFIGNFIPFAHWPAYNLPYWGWTFFEKPHVPAMIAKVQTAHALQTRDLPGRLQTTVPIPGSARFMESLGFPPGNDLRFDPYRALSFNQAMPGGTAYQAQQFREVMDDPTSPQAVMTIGSQMGIRPWPWFEYVLGYKGLMGDDWHPYDLSSFEPMARAFFDTDTTPSSWLREKLGMEPNKFLEYQVQKETRGQIMRGETADWDKARTTARQKTALFALVGMFTGFYPKEFTAEEEERLGMSAELRKAVEQDVRDTGGDPERMEIGEMWTWAKRHGATMKDEPSAINKFYEANPEYHELPWESEEEWQIGQDQSAYFDETAAIRTERDGRIADLTIPHPREALNQIWGDYFEELAAINEKYPNANITPSSLRPLEYLKDQTQQAMLRQLDETKPDYYATVEEKEEGERVYESYEDYSRALREWEAGLRATALELWGAETFSNFQHLATPEALEEYDKSHHTIASAAHYTWKKHIEPPFYEDAQWAQVSRLAGKADWENVTERISQWSDLIETVAEPAEIDPRIIAAMIDVESGGNPEAYNSRSQATGLMQVIPGEVLEGRPSSDALLDPKANIEAGIGILVEYLAGADYDLKDALYEYSGGSEWSSREAYEKQYWDRLSSKFKGLWGVSLGSLRAEARDEVMSRPMGLDVESLLPLIMMEYPGRWTPDEIRAELAGKNIMGVLEAQRVQRPDTAAAREASTDVWDTRSSLPPGVYRKALDELPEVASFLSTGENPKAALEAIEVYVDEHPVMGTAQEWAQAEREHDEFRRWVYNKYGQSVYEEQNAYYAAREEGRRVEPSERLEAYWDAHTEFRQEHPIYTKYYFPDWEPREEKAAGAGRARAPTKAEARAAEAETWTEFAASFTGGAGLLELIQSWLLLTPSQREWFLRGHPELAEWLMKQDPEWLGQLAASLGASRPTARRGGYQWKPQMPRWYKSW